MLEGVETSMNQVVISLQVKRVNEREWRDICFTHGVRYALNDLSIVRELIDPKMGTCFYCYGQASNAN